MRVKLRASAYSRLLRLVRRVVKGDSKEARVRVKGVQIRKASRVAIKLSVRIDRELEGKSWYRNAILVEKSSDGRKSK